MKSVASERLLETLNWWKTLSYRREILMPITHPRLVGPKTAAHIRRWREYEQMVLDNSITELDFREWLELPSQAENFDFLRALEFFPCELFEWNRKSRRVYHLPASLQYLCTVGNFKRLKWEDILWPYEAFVLTLEQPIELEEAPGVWSSFDTILVSHVPAGSQGKVLNLRLLRRPSGTMLGVLPQSRRTRIERCIATGDNVRAEKILSSCVLSVVTDAGTAQGFRGAQLYSTVPGCENIPSVSDHIRIEPEDLIADREQILGVPPSEEERWRAGYLSVAMKLVVGWALYMESISTNAFQNMRPPASPPTRGMAGIITAPEHICTVLVQAKLDPARYIQTPEFETTSATFKRPHWRRGHWKRANGAGPNAPKTVRVPPILIRKDLVPFFGIISGTATWIVDED